MQEWLVAGAVVQGTAVDPSAGDDSSVLLVRNVRSSGRSDWTPPGGVVDRGEDVLAGLAREVREETGLTVVEWADPLYVVVTEAPDMDWRLRVEVHRAAAVEGGLEVGEDPDGIVVEAEFVSHRRGRTLLGTTQPWVREPLLDWWGPGEVGTTAVDPSLGVPEFRFLVRGVFDGSATVERLA